MHGMPQDWNLTQRVALGEELPPLGDLGETGQRLYKYMKDKPIWKSLQAEALADGQQLTMYSFRHRYAYTTHNRPLANGQARAPKNCAEAMGHELETHLGSYSRFKTHDLASLFDEVENTESAIATNKQHALSVN